MGYLFIGWIVLVTAITVFYLNIPPPELSTRLKAWHKRGNFFRYKDFADIFYIDEKGVASNDRTLLLIHGFPTASYDWIKILDDLKKQYSRIVMTDLLGLGFSDKPKQYEYLITEQADILEAVLLNLSIPEVHVLSHDIGDTVALELLHRHNTNQGKVVLKSLCMLNAGVFPETNFPLLGQRVLKIPVVGDVFAHLVFYGALKNSFSKIFGPASELPDEEMRDFYALLRHKDGNTVMGRILQYIRQRNENKDRWVGALQKSSVPVHMIYGPADPINPPVFVDHYKKVVPNPSIDVLGSGIGHYPQWEDPVGVVNSYTNFLKRLK